MGDGVADHDFWGRPEQMTIYIARPAFKIDDSHPGKGFTK
jgi:endoglucanase